MTAINKKPLYPHKHRVEKNEHGGSKEKELKRYLTNPRFISLTERKGDTSKFIAIKR